MRKDNRGFTLIEVIIAMAIFIIVIAIGYGIINNTVTSISSNKVTTEGQSAINLVNKYLTKDLERSNPSGFIEPTSTDINSSNYSYVLKVSGLTENSQSISYIKYIVDVNNGKYSVTRKTFANDKDMNNDISKSTIEIVNKQPIQDNNPFIITNSDDNKYNVSMEYKDKTDKIYTFDVSYRYEEYVSGGGFVPDGSPERPFPPPEVPEIDDELQGSKGLNGFIKFGYKDGNKYSNIGSSKGDNHTEYGKYLGVDDKSKYDISAVLYFNSNGGHAETQIDGQNVEIKNNSESKDDFGKLNVNQLNVTVLGEIKVNLTISQKHANGSTGTPILYTVELDKKGKYTFPVDSNGKDIILKGTITKPEGANYGEVIVTFGTKK